MAYQLSDEIKNKLRKDAQTIGNRGGTSGNNSGGVGGAYTEANVSRNDTGSGYRLSDNIIERLKKDAEKIRSRGSSQSTGAFLPTETSAPQSDSNIVNVEANTSRTREDIERDIAEVDAQIAKAQKAWENTVGKSVYSDADKNVTEHAKDRLKAYESQKERLEAELWQHDQAQKYSAVTQNDDFESNKNATGAGKDTTYLYINDVNGARGTIDARGALSGGSGDLYKYSQMTPAEIDVYNYIYNTSGKKAAKEYLKFLSYDLNNRARSTLDTAVRAQAGKSKANAIALSVASVPLNLGSGAGYVDIAAQKVAKTITGSDAPIDYNRRAQTGYTVAQGTREKVMENMSDTGKFLYSTAMSMADSLAIMGISAFTGPSATLLLSGSVATSTVQEAKKNGATDMQALSLGFIAGAAEYVTERLSIENLFKFKNLRGTKAIVAQIFKQGFVESLEEVSATVINTIADILVMGDKNELRRDYEYFLEQGLTPEEAEKKAKRKWWAGLGADAGGGFLSGITFGIGGTLVTKARARGEQKKTGEAISSSPYTLPLLVEHVENGYVDENTKETLEYSEETRSVAKKIKADIAEGKKVSNVEKGKFADLILKDNAGFEKNALPQILQEVQRREDSEDEVEIEAPQRTVEDAEIVQNEADTQADTQVDTGVRAEEKSAVPQSEAQQEVATRGEVNGETVVKGDGELAERGEGVSAERGRGRFSDAYTGEAAPVGSKNIGDVRRAKNKAQTASERQSKVTSLRVKQTSAADLGIAGGSEEATLYIVPEEAYDEELKAVAEDMAANGITAHFYTGAMVVNGSVVDGFIKGNVMYIKADSARWAASETADHEKFHHVFRNKPELINALANWIRENYNAESFDAVIDTYYDKYNAVYNLDAMPTEEAVRIVLEEILADAYAGINKFGAGADVYTDVARAAAEETGKVKPNEYNANRGRGPPQNMTYDDVKNAVREVLGEQNNTYQATQNVEKVTEAQNQQGLNARQEAAFSISNDAVFMEKAIAANEAKGFVDEADLNEAKTIRKKVADRMVEIKDRGLVGIPEDIEGNTFFSNSSYGGSEKNTTVCPRSLAAEAFVDAVSEYLGRPLTVEEQIYISQDLQGRSLTPECTYCYVATDRKAYRAFLGEYISQRDAVIEKFKQNTDADVSRNGELYKNFLNGRKDTNQMYSRFKMWIDTYKSGKPMVDASHLTNMNKLMGDINSEFGAELKPQITDAMKYAQSASWAKKKVNYVAYNGHILKWKQDRIDKLNSYYGLRMYSFSDFHPAFVLENMQMITDASVRGLKMLGYTKDTDFVEIFAPTGMNINISVFGFESSGEVFENNLIGAEWAKAQDLRAKYPNVGITFVATNDTIVEWALAQDWIDVVIPYHLVRTGTEVAKAFGYHNYTDESSDMKKDEWTKENKKSIAPTEHNNDKKTYLAVLDKNNLEPRFKRFLENPNYMKLVNECRQPASESKPVQPRFGEDAAMKALAKLEANGYYQPVGGSVDKMYEIAAEVGEQLSNKITQKFALSEEVEETEDLIAMHNVSEQQLLDAIGRGGFLMPSVAVTNKPFSLFGDISVIFRKNTIDPAANQSHRLYGADAWTPTQTNLKKNAQFDEAATEETVERINELIGEQYAEELFGMSAEEFEEAIKNADGSIYDALAYNVGMQTAYAMEKGLIDTIPESNGVVDHVELEQSLDKVLDTDEGWRQYKRWLTSISDSIITDYDVATNEDILNNMEAQPRTAKPFKLSVNGELVVPAAEYASIDQARQNRNRLSENAETETKIVAKEFLNFASELGVNVETAVKAINAAFEGRYSLSDIINTFAKYGIRIDNSTARELQDLYKKAVELPTGYFEAKPHRFIGLQEIAAVVVPDNASAEIRQALADNGIEERDYDPNVEGDRSDVVNSVENVRFALSEEADLEYFNAVERGDMEAAQQMVDKAARLAGWIPEDAYHGTGEFGFTRFDPEMSDDKMSIFLSSSSGVSSTYSGGGTVRQISQKSEITSKELDNADPKKVLELLRKYIDPNIEMLDENEREAVIKENKKHIENAIEMAVELPKILGDRWNAGTQAYLNDVIKFLKEMATANTYDEFMSANMEYEAALWEMKWEDGRATNVLVELLGDDVRKAYLGLTNYLETALYKGNTEYTQKHHRDVFGLDEALNELHGTMFKGIYRLYTKPGKQLVIDANGGYWNQIDGKHIEESGLVRTRDVAKYAKEKGYDSVRIKNLRDSADYSYMAPSDVFIFFDGDRLKSADPVTYDDDGNVIPLSERFNSDKNDIRFAVSDEYDVAPEDRTWEDTGDRKFNSYAYDHPELRPFYKKAANAMFYDLMNSIKGERWSITSDSKEWTGTKRSTTDGIARLLDNGGMTYKRIQEALLTMMYKTDDAKAMNRADVKKVELELDTMLQEGYTDPQGYETEPDQEYRRLLDAIKSGYSSVEEADAAYEAEVRDAAYDEQVEAEVWEGYDQRADEMYDEVYNAYEPAVEAYEEITQEERDYLGELVESADELRLQRMLEEKERAVAELDEENELIRQRNLEYAEEANNYFNALNAEEIAKTERKFAKILADAEGALNVDISNAPDTSAEHWESISAELLENERRENADDDVIRDSGKPREKYELKVGAQHYFDALYDSVIEQQRRKERENAVATAVENDGFLPDGVSEEEILAAQELYKQKQAAKKAAEEAKYEGLTADEIEAAKEVEAKIARQEYLEGVDRKNFVGSDAMKKLGIKIANSIANYNVSKSLIDRAKANAALVKQMDKEIRNMRPTEEEKYFARGIVDNVFDEYSLPAHLDAERILEIADYMIAKNAGRTDLFAAQKADINNRNRELAAEKFAGAENAKRVSLTRLNYMTPRRAMIEMFGEKQGEEIYRTFFAPVRSNDAERIRFAEKLRQEALEIEGKNGKKGKLTKEERALTQMLMEGKAAGEMLAKMETGGKERIEAAVKKILKGESIREENGKYVVGEKGGDELSAKEADIARRYAARKQAWEAINTGVYDKKKVDGTRITNAAKHFSKQYDMLYEAINEFLVAHGEQPIGFIKGYAPHLQAEDTLQPLERLLAWMGAPTDITDLRAQIAGETHNRKPNRKWNPHFLSREVASQTEYDVYKGFEEYVDYISEVFYHMDDIMRLRAASRYLRTAYATKESMNILQQIQEIRNGSYYDKMNFLFANNKVASGQTFIGAEVDEALDKYVDEILAQEENKTAVGSTLVMWLDNYTNLLAGKQNAMDRGLEQRIGRKGIRAANKAVNRLISAQVVGNMSSALNQMAQLPLTITELGSGNVSKALWDMVRHSGEMRRWSVENDFLVARKGTTILNYQISNKITNGLAKPLELADWFMASLTARAAYHQALQKGMNVDAAMDYSVQKAENIMGSRNKASKPVAFSTKGPMMRLVNAYQIEVLNQWQHVVKDLPREYKAIAQSRGAWAAAGRVVKDLLVYLILAAFINRIAEETYGGTPAPLDLLGIVGNFVASGNGLTLNEGIVRVINSMTGKMFGKEWLKENHTFDSEMPDEFDWGAALGDTAYTLSSEIPFLNNIMAVAGLTDDKTVFAAGINDAKESFFGKKSEGGAIDHFFVTRREREEGEQESAEVLDGLYDVAMGISEFILGGRQLQKTIQGVVTLSGGGEKNSGGNLMYPVADTVGNWIKGTLFGKTALENSRAYYASGAAALSGKRNEQYYFMVENGIDEETAYGVAQGLADVVDKFRDQMEYIMNTDLPDETKNGLAFSLASEAAYDRYVSYDLESKGIEPAEFMFAWAFYQSATGEDTAGQTEDFLRQQGVNAGDIAKIIAALKKK